jgi:hypothetical protein
MKDPARFIRQKIITALSGNITYDGSAVPVYGTVPSTTGFPYIRVYGVNTVEVDQNRSSFTTEVTTRIEAVIGNINYLREDTKNNTYYRAILELENRVLEL